MCYRRRSSAATTSNAIYYSFGNVTSGSTSLSRYQYTGQEYDADTGLYYYNARWYDPKTGRFLSQDPLGFAAGDLNLSRYVNNGVVNATDPSGLEEFNWARDRELDELMRRAKARGDDVAYRMLLNARRRLHGAWGELDTGPYDPYDGDDWTGLNQDEVIRKHLRFVETAHDAAENYVEGVRLIPGYGDAIDLVDLAKDPTDSNNWSRVCPGPGDLLRHAKNLRRASKFADEADDAARNAKRFTDSGTPKFPGSNTTKPPDGFEWRGKPGSTPGSKEGNYFNPETREILRPDLGHSDPIGGHWDYRDPNGKWWRIFPDGRMEPK